MQLPSAITLLATLCLPAQDDTVEITGTLLDAQGRPAAATVLFRGPAGATSAGTDATGAYLARVRPDQTTVEIFWGARPAHGPASVKIQGCTWEGRKAALSYPLKGRTDLHLAVEKPDGSFLPGLKMLVAPASENRPGPRVSVLLDDASALPEGGVYVARSIGGGRFDLLILDSAGEALEGVESGHSRIEVPATGAGVHRVRLKALPRDRQLLCVVRGSGGERVGRSDVVVFRSADVMKAVVHRAPFPSMATDEQGRCAFGPLPPGRYAVLAKLPGLDRKESFEGALHAGPNSGLPLYVGAAGGVDLTGALAKVLNLALPPSRLEDLAAIQGEITDKATGKRLEGIEVILWSGPGEDLILCDTQYPVPVGTESADRSAGPLPIVRVTPADRAFRIQRLLPGTYTFVVLDRSRKYPGAFITVQVAAGIARKVELPLDASAGVGSIRGRVAIPAAPGMLRLFAVDAGRGAAGAAFVQPDGSFEIPRLPAGAYRLHLVENSPLIRIALKDPPEVAVEAGKTAFVDLKTP